MRKASIGEAPSPKKSPLRFLMKWAFIGCLPFLTACSEPSSPSALPAAPAAPSYAPPPPQGNPTVRLDVSAFSAVLVPPDVAGDYFRYRVALGLSVASGTSGAHVRYIQFSAPEDSGGASCGWPIVIKPGDTWEMDDSYCWGMYELPETKTAASSLTVNVNFTDDAGHIGSVQASTPVGR